MLPTGNKQSIVKLESKAQKLRNHYWKSKETKSDSPSISQNLKLVAIFGGSKNEAGSIGGEDGVKERYTPLCTSFERTKAMDAKAEEVPLPSKKKCAAN